MKRFGKLYALAFVSYLIITYLIERVGGLTDVTIVKRIWTAAIFSLVYSLVMVQFIDNKKDISKKVP